MAQQKFEFPVPNTVYCNVLFPEPHVLLVVLNRPNELNCINVEGHEELDAIWSWMDKEPQLICGIITGSGRAFSAGEDLIEWNNLNEGGMKRKIVDSGFAALSRRSGRKPVIAAVNGICYGGGCEAIVNCDLVVAAKKATFALPEVRVGLVATGGALPRLIRTVGKARAMEMALTGRTLSADEAREWGLVNKVVGDREDEVVEAAVEYARMIASNSPDAVIVSRECVKMGWEGVGVEDGVRIANETWGPRLYAGENVKEGIRAFAEKRKPQWKPLSL